MQKYSYIEARETITAICEAAAAGKFDCREKFMAMLAQNPHIAVQGYNPYGKIFFWNNASAHLYGHSEAAAVNQDRIELILPPEMHKLACDMIASGRKMGKMPDASACELLRYNGESVTVFSGHLVFNWDDTTIPEFYCVDIPIRSNADE